MSAPVGRTTRRIDAVERLQRLLSIVSWVAAQPEGAPVEEVVRRFGVAEPDLLEDLSLASMVGADSPDHDDMPIEFFVEDGRIHVFLYSFRQPLRLSPEQGLALVAAGTGLLAVPGADPTGPLARGLAKLAGVLGISVSESVEVDLGQVHPLTFRRLQEAVDQHRQVELDYYALGRDERTRRVVDPRLVFHDGGEWYLAGHCHRAKGERVFRIDRIEGLALLDTTFTPPAEPPTRSSYRAGAHEPRVTLDLDPDAHWVAESYPVDEVAELTGGRLRVVLPVSARPWLERLLVRLGPTGVLRAADEGIGPTDLAAEVATRILGRYDAI